MEELKLKTEKTPTTRFEDGLEDLRKKPVPQQLMTRELKLDVGCGHRPTGDVNCDLYVTDINNHRAIGVGNILNAKDIPNFIKCDACHLPFKSNQFDIVYSAQLIEHLPNPQAFFAELVRVSKNKIIIETAHRLGECLRFHPRKRSWLKKHHISKMNFRYLSELGKVFNCRVSDSYVITWMYFPHLYCHLIKFPREFGMEFITK